MVFYLPGISLPPSSEEHMWSLRSLVCCSQAKRWLFWNRTQNPSNVES